MVEMVVKLPYVLLDSLRLSCSIIVFRECVIMIIRM